MQVFGQLMNTDEPTIYNNIHGDSLTINFCCHWTCSMSNPALCFSARALFHLSQQHQQKIMTIMTLPDRALTAAIIAGGIV